MRLRTLWWSGIACIWGAGAEESRNGEASAPDGIVPNTSGREPGCELVHLQSRDGEVAPSVIEQCLVPLYEDLAVRLAAFSGWNGGALGYDRTPLVVSTARPCETDIDLETEP